MEDELTFEEQQTLLRMARDAMERGVKGEKVTPLDQSTLSPHLREEGASSVTLTIKGRLRGCIGGLEARQSLAEDVRQHAVAAALEYPRFPPVSERELSGIQIEISRLTRPQLLDYRDANDLLSQIRPHLDGVILRDGIYHRGTFLPQVWEKIPDPAEFLNNLCHKIGVSKNLWRSRHLDVLTYQVEEFHEHPHYPT